MRVIAKSTLREFWERHPEAERPFRAWHTEAKAAAWRKPADVKARYAAASILKNGRIVFNVGGNKYRLVAWINFRAQIVYIRFVGTHPEYDRIDAETV